MEHIDRKKVMKEMTWIQRIEYIWMYDKLKMLAAVCVIVAIYLAVTMYKGITTPVLLNVVITGGNNQQSERLTEQFSEYAGIEDKDGIVRIQANVQADGEGINSKTALTTLLGANAVDVLVCNGHVYEEYSAQGGFVEDKTLSLDKSSFLYEEDIVQYEDIYAAIPINGKNSRLAEKFLEFLQEGK